MFSLKDYNIPIDLLTYVILKFISYFDLDHVLPCFRLTPKEIAQIKHKIYEKRLVFTTVRDYFEYRLENKLHRLDGPAIVYMDASAEWYFNDKLHREDGPAVEGPGIYRMVY